jgi:hypothetical protein
MKFFLYGNNVLIGDYSTRLEASLDAFELMLDGALTTFEIIEVSSQIPDIPKAS